MNKLTSYFPFFLFFSLIQFSCIKYDYQLHSEENVSIPLYIQGLIEEPNQLPIPFHFQTGDTDDVFEQVFWSNSIISHDFGPSLITGMYSSADNIYISGWDNGIFAGFQFWSSDLPTDQKWSKTELEDLFQIGTTFAVGQGPNKVDIQLRLPINTEQYVDLGNSKSSYVFQSSGYLTITDMEDVEYPSRGINNTPLNRSGKRITCIFECEIGRFRIPSNGFPDVFFTDEIVSITEGEAVFFVDY